jgi:hypothetical protein
MLNKAMNRSGYVTSSIDTKIGKLRLIENLKHQKRDLSKKPSEPKPKPNAANAKTPPRS